MIYILTFFFSLLCSPPPPESNLRYGGGGEVIYRRVRGGVTQEDQSTVKPHPRTNNQLLENHSPKILKTEFEKLYKKFHNLLLVRGKSPWRGDMFTDDTRAAHAETPERGCSSFG